AAPQQVLSFESTSGGAQPREGLREGQAARFRWPRRGRRHDRSARILMRLGLLPALGGSLTELRQSGQDARLLDGYIRLYGETFEGVSYFSYAPESLATFTADPRLLARVMVFAPPAPQPRALRAWDIPRRHAAAMRSCAVSRVFQITGVIPALLARRRFG